MTALRADRVRLMRGHPMGERELYLILEYVAVNMRTISQKLKKKKLRGV
jgi:hypothetical protein